MGLISNRNLIMIFGLTLIGVIGVSLISPALPLIQDSLGLSKPQVSYFVTVFTLPGIIFSLLLGIISDKIGRKPIAVFSLFLFGIAGTLIPFSGNFSVMMALRFIQGCAAAGLSTISLAMIGDHFSGKDRAVAMGYTGSVLSIGTASYPFIGGILASLGWKYPFYVFFIAIPVGILILLLMPKVEQSNGGGPFSFSKASNIFSGRVILLLASTIITFILLYGTYLTYYALYLDEKFGANSTEIGIVMSVMSISTAIISAQTGHVLDKLGSEKAMFVGFIMYAAGLTLMLFQPSLLAGVIAVIFYGIGQGCNLPLLQTLLISSVSSDARGMMSAIYSSSLRIGQSAGPLIMALLYETGGYDLVFTISTIMALVMAIMLFEYRDMISPHVVKYN